MSFYDEQYYCEPSEFDEKCEELILVKAYEDIPENARILCVEERIIEELIVALAERIPHENLYLVKSRMVQYPYQNYHIFSEMNLKRLFGQGFNYSENLFDKILLM